MHWLAGVAATTKRIDILHQAAESFVHLVQNNHGVGMISFDQDAYPHQPVNRFLSGAIDPNRTKTILDITALAFAGATSIGKGVALARATLDPVAGYDQKALVVFTDGLENTAPFIADATGGINDRTPPPSASGPHSRSAPAPSRPSPLSCPRLRSHHARPPVHP